jgi:hypothetical protein
MVLAHKNTNVAGMAMFHSPESHYRRFQQLDGSRTACEQGNWKSTREMNHSEDAAGKEALGTGGPGYVNIWRVQAVSTQNDIKGQFKELPISKDRSTNGHQ